MIFQLDIYPFFYKQKATNIPWWTRIAIRLFGEELVTDANFTWYEYRGKIYALKPRDGWRVYK